MSIDPKNWKPLLQALNRQSCILLLGPNISTTGPKETPLTSDYASRLSEELLRSNIAFDRNFAQDLSYLMQRSITRENQRLVRYLDASDYFTQNSSYVNSTQMMLASLPFSIVINTSLDNNIYEAFKKCGKFQTNFDYYNYREPRLLNSPPPSAAEPLIYNLFGHFSDLDSMVLTEMDQVAFIEKVIKDDPPLPRELMRWISGLKTFLFIGFDWEQWQLRMLLKVLQLEVSGMGLSPTKLPISGRTRDFYESQFRFSFIEQDDLNFVSALKDSFEGKDIPENLLKRIFISHTEADTSSQESLVRQLTPLGSEIKCSGTVAPGKDKARWIEEAIAGADIILLLISPEYLSDKEVINTELESVLKKYQDGKVQVFPIILRPCPWESFEELTRLPEILPKAGNSSGKPISTWENEADAFYNVADVLKRYLT